MGSINFKVNGETIIIGSNKKYAKIHQEGGTIYPKSKPFLQFKLDDGRIIRVKKVVIPQRKYLGLSEQDEKDIKKLTFSSFIRE